jgi:hypothetical protein
VDTVKKNQPGRRALEADAVYCAAVGVAAMALDRKLGARLSVPRHVVRFAGGATLVWGGVVAGMSRAQPVSPSLKTVAAANAIGAAGLAVLGIRQPRPFGQLLFVGLALEVGAFAGIQIAALIQERKLAKLEEASK